MIVSKLDEEQRRALAAVFVSGGWALLKEEFKLRKQRMINDLIYSTDRSYDYDRRAGIVAIDMLLKIETEVFAPTPAPEPEAFALPQPSVNRY